MIDHQEGLLQVSDISATPPTAAELSLMKQLADYLQAAYPNHFWMVGVNAEQGIAHVLNARLSMSWGYLFHIRSLQFTDEVKAQAIKAGGEILERFGVRRGCYDADEIKALPEIAGFKLGDFSENKAGIAVPSILRGA